MYTATVIEAFKSICQHGTCAGSPAEQTRHRHASSKVILSTTTPVPFNPSTRAEVREALNTMLATGEPLGDLHAAAYCKAIKTIFEADIFAPSPEEEFLHTGTPATVVTDTSEDAEDTDGKEESYNGEDDDDDDEYSDMDEDEGEDSFVPTPTASPLQPHWPAAAAPVQLHIPGPTPTPSPLQPLWSAPPAPVDLTIPAPAADLWLRTPTPAHIASWDATLSAMTAMYGEPKGNMPPTQLPSDSPPLTATLSAKTTIYGEPKGNMPPTQLSSDSPPLTSSPPPRQPGDQDISFLAELHSRYPDGVTHRTMRNTMKHMWEAEPDLVKKKEKGRLLHHYRGPGGTERMLTDTSKWLNYGVRRVYRETTKHPKSKSPPRRNYYLVIYIKTPPCPYFAGEQDEKAWIPNEGFEIL
ncbi:hypothetical protein CF319_g7483 [Tilletia indica]|uniref:Uncharacterized protein n=1 Tax=Tilletia indica TaxID=43049 RepID=A0A177TQC9_9BASI|nr:hypothetical protein CF319_g7483 [Tilletia indica]KAE8250484.1 hypothetical protein A4X13_0g4692 [Tilletia indica]